MTKLKCNKNYLLIKVLKNKSLNSIQYYFCVKFNATVEKLKKIKYDTKELNLQ